MEELIIHVEELRAEPLKLDVDLAPDQLDLADEAFAFPKRVGGEVVFRLVGHDVIAGGWLSTQVETPCSRCLEPARLKLRAEVSEVWIPGEKQDEAEALLRDEAGLARHYQDDLIKPVEAFRELLMAELPVCFPCKPDCRGLCPECGANLNREACRCPGKTAAASGDAALPAWKRQLRKLDL